MLMKDMVSQVTLTDSTCDELQRVVHHNPSAMIEFITVMYRYYVKSTEYGSSMIRASEVEKDLEDTACSCESCTMWPEVWLPDLVDVSIGEILGSMESVFNSFGVTYWVMEQQRSGPYDPYIFFYDGDPVVEIDMYLYEPDYDF